MPAGLGLAPTCLLHLLTETVEAAFETFAERGHHQTGIADIARRLGIGHGTLYRHFENKRDIFDHVIQDVAIRLSALLHDENAPTAVNTLPEYSEQCRRITQRFATFVEGKPKAFRLLMLEATSVDAELTNKVFKIMSVSCAATFNHLENGVRRGFLLPDLDTQAMGKVVMSIIAVGLMHHLSSPDDREGTRRHMDAGIEMPMQAMGRQGA